MKQPVRFFALGILTASVIIFLILLLTNTSVDKKQAELSVDEMIAALKEDGYRVVSEEDYITYTVNKDLATNEDMKDADKKQANDNKDTQKESEDKATNAKKEEPKQDDAKKDENKDKEESDVKSYTLNIKSGMMPQEVAKILAENGIVDDATSFSTYLEDNGYSPYVQIDKYKVNSDMGYKKLAETITKNRRP